MSGLRIGSLCSGYGGLDMAVESVFGGELAWVSDIDKGACKILAHRFPGVPNIGDMTAVDWAAVEPVDVICGGTPCQDLSHAGKRAGMTEGSRSNLWVAMREAIAVIRPKYVVWENVRGAASAEADSDLEQRPGLLAGVRRRPGQPLLRALGRVVGDLSDLGYVGQVRGLRAADVGAPHGRFRYFILATDAASDQGRLQHGDGGAARHASRLGRNGREAQLAGSLLESARDRAGSLLPSPRSSDTNGAGQHGDGGLDLRTAVAMLPTPRATDGTKGGPNQRGSSGDLMLPSAVAGLVISKPSNLLPTPAVNDMGEGKTVEAWDAWTERMKAEHGNGNGHGASLSIEAQRLLPTPTAEDAAASGGSTPNDVTLTDAVVRTNLGKKENPRHAVPTEAGPREELRDVRGGLDAEEVRQRPARGQDRVPQEDALLAEVREQPQGDPARQSQMAGTSDHGEGLMPGVRIGRAPARTSPRPEPCEQRPGEPRRAVCFMPPDPALAGGLRSPCGCDTNWGQYEAAIRRWERVLGRCAPPPTQLGPKGGPRLDARFSEFLMGLPAGWVTDIPGITRNEALRALGNGVVPQQATAALVEMLRWEAAA